MLSPAKPVQSFSKDGAGIIAPKDFGAIVLAEPTNKPSQRVQSRVSPRVGETGEFRGVQHGSEEMIYIAPFPP